MTGKKILILGGGLGGITAAGALRRLCGPEHRVVVIERNAKFSLHMANLWLMTGERQRAEEGERELSSLAERGIEWVQAEIEAIDPVARTVGTSAGTLEGDYLIIALGAERHPEAVPGFAEAALNLYDPAGAVRIREALETFPGGRVVVLVARTPFSCPSAPYEAAFLAESLLRRRGVRERSQVAVYTPEDLPMPVAGPEVGSELVRMLQGRGIEFHAEQIVMRIDPAVRTVRFELEDAKFDLLIGVPPHRAPSALRAAKLTDASGWVPVDASSLRTRHVGVYAIGDATSIRLPIGMFLPKAGVFADEQARIVAENIAAEIAGEAAARRFNGHGFCYIEIGDNMAAYGAGNFYGIPAPTISLEPPSTRFCKEKHEIERAAQVLWQ
jgi:sulfide:quinone oxidoreductase